MSIDISVIWFVIIVFATLMYIVMDGFDLGIGMLFSVVHDGEERDVMVNSVAPVWDGNETWLVLGGAGLFGAFPLAYAVITDALVIPLTAMLIGLIFRGVAFEFRFKAVPSHRIFWDYAFAGGSLLATFSQGIVVGAQRAASEEHISESNQDDDGHKRQPDGGEALHHRRRQNRPVRHSHPGAHTGELHRPHATENFNHAHHQADLERRAPAAEVVGKDANRRVGEEHRDKAWNNQN